MISADEAQKVILEKSNPVETVSVPLSASLRRFLAGPVVAPIDLPPFDNAAMDGFAVRSGDTAGASPSRPVSLKVIGTIAAGDDAGARYASPLQPGETISIMTGATMPPGADTVVPFEETLSPCSGCRIDHPVVPGHHVRRRGEDVGRGESVCGTGEPVTSRTIALLAALGLGEVEVFKSPTIKILVTGSELTKTGLPLAPGRIYNSNGPALTAALQEIGIRPESIASTSDSEGELEEALKACLDADVLITIGGVSAGDFDLVPEKLKERGARILFHRVAIKPGKPFLFATLGKKLIFGLPGNPVSSLMVFDRFVRPSLLKMMGAKKISRAARIATAIEDLKGTEGREDYLRGIVESREGAYFARSAGAQGSAMLRSLASANATLILPATVKKVSAGEKVPFEFFREDLR